MTTYRYTVHAAHRFRERFPCHDMRSELSRSIPFGGQFGDNALRLSPCGAVFAIRDGMVLTTLTKEMALANMQASHGELRAVSTRVVDVPKAAIAWRTSAVINPEIESAVCELANEHAERDERGLKTIQATKKTRNAEVRRILGHENHKTKAAWELYRAKYREARERLWAATREARAQLRKANP